MEITRTATPSRRAADLNVWYCEKCEVVHLSVDKKVIDLTRLEFDAFAEEVTSINYHAWSHGAQGVIDLEKLSPRYAEQ